MDTASVPSAERRVVMGKIVGAHGVGGTVRVDSFCDPPESLLKYKEWWLSRPGFPGRLTAVIRGQASTRGLLVTLADVNDRDAAAAMKGLHISVDRERLPVLSENQYYWTDLEGLFVVNSAGQSLGVVDHLFDSGAHPILVTQDGDKQRLIPFVWERVVLSVDQSLRQILVDWDPDF